MVDDRGGQETARGVTRRDLMMRGAVVGGALVWATPVVQSISSTALAAGPGSTTTGLASTYSEIALLFNCGGTLYRVKYGPQGAAPGVINPSDAGSTFVLGTGKDISSMPCDDFFLNEGTNTAPAGFAGVQAILGADGSVTVTFSPTAGCTLDAFAWHNGQCCFQEGTDTGGVAVGTYGSTATYGGVTIGVGTAYFPGNPPNGSGAGACP